jgi:hypothetical protein
MPPIEDAEHGRFFIGIIGPNKRHSAFSFMVLSYCDREDLLCGIAMRRFAMKTNS